MSRVDQSNSNRWFAVLLTWVMLCVACCYVGGAEPKVAPLNDTWRYTLEQPNAGWSAPEYDDRQWKEGQGGFGTPDTPGARLGTQWDTQSIWLRQPFQLTKVPNLPGLLLHHDEDVTVHLNGHEVLKQSGYSTKYKTVALSPAAKQHLRPGENLLAVSCRQTTGGQFIDVHVVDLDNLPKLPVPRRSTQPYLSELMTSWGADVTADNAWTEYPRPQMRRDQWQNLNGHWDYAITSETVTDVPPQWAGKILVPFPLESKLSGVRRNLLEDEALWYHRSFDVADSSGQRTLIHFEAVDYRCHVFVNGTLVGTHQGGNVPFSVDATAALRHGKNSLVVRVEDETERWQLRGKQTARPRTIWYTQVSGIWQTVWLEQVAQVHIDRLTFHTDVATGQVRVRATLNGAKSAGVNLRVRASLNGEQVAETVGTAEATKLRIEKPQLWSPANPTLYDLKVSLLDQDGKVLDQVESYVGLRQVGKEQDEQGNWHFTLNGQRVFHFGPLDQGWWPDGLLTPPSDEAMLSDIEYLRAAGFNMIRKHIKVEPRRYYYHCDRLGMMLWQDHVSGGEGPAWTKLQPQPPEAQWPDRQHRQFMDELAAMVDALENHPSIVCWVPFNEAWGQHRTGEVSDWLAKRDPSRLINVASGGNFLPFGDVVDAHSYPHPSFPFHLDTEVEGSAGTASGQRFDGYIKVVGEFGGHGWAVDGHLWAKNRRNWGYGKLPADQAEYARRYEESIRRLNELRSRGIAGGVYTQTSDVEGEINGLLTYDRKVKKLSAKRLAELHKPLYEAAPTAEISGRWPAARANAWYDQLDWPVGANFAPSSAINQLEMWQAETWDPKGIERELGWAAAMGMNCMRVYLHDLLWKHDRDGYLQRIDEYLRLADSHGIRTMFVIFDSVWHPHPQLGQQPSPRKGVHNSGWVQSPGIETLVDSAAQDRLKPYVQGLLRRFGQDQRVLAWDLFNEPENTNGASYGPGSETPDLDGETKTARAAELLDKTFRWAREINPSQPLTCGVWRDDAYGNRPGKVAALALKNSDVISFHSYSDAAQTARYIRKLQQFGRPLFCTEYMARSAGSTFQTILPLFQQHRVAAINWGLVAGKSNTIYPWSSWRKPFDQEPSPWFHDIFRQNGDAYDAAETEFIKQTITRQHQLDAKRRQ